MSMAIDGTNGLTFPNTGTQLYGGCGSGSQTWQTFWVAGTNTGATRTSGTTYTNSTNLPIMVCEQGSLSGGTITVNGVIVCYHNSATILGACVIVPVGGTYVINDTIYNWAELR